jgi:hypothetical protein
MPVLFQTHRVAEQRMVVLYKVLLQIHGYQPRGDSDVATRQSIVYHLWLCGSVAMCWYS